MMEDKIDELFGYVQERCLWQFFSRTWDRQENIDGVLNKAFELFTGKEPKLASPADKLFYADAKSMVSDCLARFPWIKHAEEAEVRQVLDGLKTRLVENVITKSTNRELRHHLY